MTTTVVEARFQSLDRFFDPEVSADATHPRR